MVWCYPWLLVLCCLVVHGIRIEVSFTMGWTMFTRCSWRARELGWSHEHLSVHQCLMGVLLKMPCLLHWLLLILMPMLAWVRIEMRFLKCLEIRKKRPAKLLHIRRAPTLDVGDFVWLSLAAKKLHINHKNGEPIDERPFKVLKKLAMKLTRCSRTWPMCYIDRKWSCSMLWRNLRTSWILRGWSMMHEWKHKWVMVHWFLS